MSLCVDTKVTSEVMVNRFAGSNNNVKTFPRFKYFPALAVTAVMKLNIIGRKVLSLLF